MQAGVPVQVCSIFKHGRDWRGPPQAGCGTKWSNEAGRDPRNPGKPLKNGLLAILEDGFSGENPRVFMQTIDAPSMALLL